MGRAITEEKTKLRKAWGWGRTTLGGKCQEKKTDEKRLEGRNLWKTSVRKVLDTMVLISALPLWKVYSRIALRKQHTTKFLVTSQKSFKHALNEGKFCI